MKIDVKNFFTHENGYKEEVDLERKPKYEDFNLKKPITAHATLLKMREGIDVYLEDIETEVERDCGKCLQKFTEKVVIPEAERVFYFKKSVDLDRESDKADIFLVDRKHQELDVTELLRQEILLHFEASPVCSKSCLGLCPKCGTNLNEKKCNCEIDLNPDNPFKKLLNSTH